MKWPYTSTAILVLTLSIAACGGSGGGTSATPVTDGIGGDFELVVSPVFGNTATPGSVAEVSVNLPFAPVDDVQFAVASSDSREAKVSPSTLTFTPENWEIPQLLFSTGINETVINGDQNYSIVLGTVNSNDPSYTGVNPKDIAVGGLKLELLGLSGPTINVTGDESVFEAITEYNDEESLTYSLTAAPAGMIIDAEFGTLTWTPTLASGSEEVTIFVTDGTLENEFATTLEVALESELAVDTQSTTTKVVIEPDSVLNGMSFSSDVVDLSTIRVTTLATSTGIPEELEAISAPFRLAGFPENESIELKLPAVSLPEGYTAESVELYVYATEASDIDEPAWSPRLVLADYEGDELNPVVTTQLENLNGIYVLGFNAFQPQEEDLNEPTGAVSQQSPFGQPRLTDITKINCNFVLSEVGSSTSKRVQACLYEGDPDFFVFIKDFARLNSTPATDIDEFVAWLYDARSAFTDLGLTFDNSFWVYAYPFTGNLSNAFGYVSPSDNYKTLYVNTNETSKIDLQGTAVHEYFHQAQARTTVAGKTNVISQRGNKKQWITEGTANWFEDYVYDGLNSYVTFSPNPLDRVLDVGFASPEGDRKKNPYSRFALWKEIDRACDGFTGTLKLADIFNADLSADRSGLSYFANLLATSDCDFGSSRGLDAKSELETMLLHYQYATLVKNDMRLIDSNESESAFRFQPSGRELVNEKWAPDLQISDSEQFLITSRYRNIWPGGAKKIRIAGSNSTLPENKEAYFYVESMGPDLIVSVVSDDPAFVGNADTILEGEQHITFSTDQSDKLIYDFGGKIPEINISLINTSETERSRGKIGMGVQFKDGEYSWRSPISCNEGDEGDLYARKWNIIVNKTGSELSGGVYFHACPGGGRSQYALTGTIENNANSFTLSGRKNGGRGPLFLSTPENATFTFVINREPSPNYAR